MKELRIRFYNDYFSSECYLYLYFYLYFFFVSGSTGENVIVTGDSAGGNLAVTVALRAIAHKVRRPTGIMSTYGCMLVKYVPSPSRLLALMDPLLPLGILSQVLAGKLEAHSPVNMMTDCIKRYCSLHNTFAVVFGHFQRQYTECK